MATIDFINKTFGRWTVIKQVENKKSRDIKFLCRCECGTEREVLGKNLKNGRSKSCGCYKKEVDRQRMIARNKAMALDLKGQKYGLLTPLEPTNHRTPQGSIIWKCQCDCGNITYVSVDGLRGQHPICSCGCEKQSIGEKLIENILKENSIQYIREWSPKELQKYCHLKGRLRYDFYLPEQNKIIEFDGRQHFEEINFFRDSLEERQAKDLIKNSFALVNNIPIIRIPYWERDNITLDMIMGDQYLVKEE